MAAAGDVVLTERIDHIGSGDVSFPVPVMGVFEVRDGKIARWRDYFDTGLLGKMMAGEDVSDAHLVTRGCGDRALPALPPTVSLRPTMADAALTLPEDIIHWIEDETGGVVTATNRVPGGASREAWFIDVKRDGATDPLFLRYSRADAARRHRVPAAAGRGRSVHGAAGHRRHRPADPRRAPGARSDAVGAHLGRELVLPDPGSRRAGARRPRLHPQPRRAPPARPARSRPPELRPGEDGARARARRDREHAPPGDAAVGRHRSPPAPQPRLAGAQRARLRRSGRLRPGRHRPRQLHVRERQGHRGRRLGARPLRRPDGRHRVAVVAHGPGHVHALPRPAARVREAVRQHDRRATRLVLPPLRRDPAHVELGGRGRTGRGAPGRPARGARHREQHHLRDAPSPPHHRGARGRDGLRAPRGRAARRAATRAVARVLRRDARQPADHRPPHRRQARVAVDQGRGAHPEVPQGSRPLRPRVRGRRARRHRRAARSHTRVPRRRPASSSRAPRARARSATRSTCGTCGVRCSATTT